MKVVVITGGARGFGLEMAKEFRKNNYNVVILDVNKDALYDAETELAKIKSILISFSISDESISQT